jgi:GDPmannose 4,6-dehydratase
MAARRALVTGAAGQDGYYLLRLLNGLGYAVHAHSSRAGEPDRRADASWHVGPLTDRAFLDGMLGAVQPDEIYNLAAISSPRLSWQMPRETAEMNALVPLQICEWIVASRPGCRLFQASSSEIFGRTQDEAQNEETACAPQSPYGIAKLYAHNIVGAYRRQYNLHACSGILFNHESPRRPLSYVSQKIAYAAAAISLGLAESPACGEDGKPIVLAGKVHLGNLDVRRDFGFAGDTVEAMHLILQHPTADDYVVGTGDSRSIREFCDAAFTRVGLEWSDHVVFDPGLMRKVDSLFTRADASKLRRVLGWAPKTSFAELVAKMVDANVAALKTSRPET